jgi:hypothetical protein
MGGFVLFFAPAMVRAQDAPLNVSSCDLVTDPKMFDGKFVRVRGTFSVHFEDFSLATRCGNIQGIWLAFGGDVPGIVVSTVNDNQRRAGQDIRVEGVPYGIKKDENFLKLYAMLAALDTDKPKYRVTATLTGPFFAGREGKGGDGQTYFTGYGHLGCCSLLLITEVSDPPVNLEIRGKLLGPDGKPMPGFSVLDDILGGSHPERQKTVTDDGGNFRFTNSGELLRFEDPKYRPVALPIKPGARPVRVKLQEASPSDWGLHPCGSFGDSPRRVGFSVLFTLPNGERLERRDEDDFHLYSAYPPGASADEAELFIYTREQSAGEPDDSVGSSSSKQRWIKNEKGAVIGIDARGVARHGERWRADTLFDHDFIRYVVPAKKWMPRLDAIIDSACIAKQ